MGGPIVRSGPSPEFSRNWENVFGKGEKKPAGAAGADQETATAPATKKAKAAKKTAKKSAKKGKK